MTKLPPSRIEKIGTPNGSQLCVQVFSKTSSPKAKIVIAGAMGVKQPFYQTLAMYLSQEGYTVLTFDYTGIGDSLEGPISANPATLSSWGTNDLETILAFATSSMPGVPLYFIGHSIGGQLLSLTRNNDLIDKYLLVACQLPYWKNFRIKDYLQLLPLWYLLIPLLSRSLNYFPGARFGLGESIPKEVALEWSRWAKTPNGLFDYYQDLPLEVWSKPGLAYSFSDDWMATKQSFKALLKNTNPTQLNWQHIHPQDIEENRIGHFGFFRKKVSPNLWQKMLRFFES